MVKSSSSRARTCKFKSWVYKLLASKSLVSLCKLFMPHLPIMTIITPTSNQNLECHLKPTHLAKPVHPPILLILLLGWYFLFPKIPTAIALIQLLVISLYTIVLSSPCHFYPLLLLPSAPSTAWRGRGPWHHPQLFSSLTCIWFNNKFYSPLL